MEIYSEITNYIHLSLQSFKRNDNTGANQFLQFAAELFPIGFPSGKTALKQNILTVFDEPLRVINSLHWRDEVDESLTSLAEYSWYLIENLCANHNDVLSEIYHRVSEAKYHFGLLDEAVEYAGQALVLRIRTLGLIHEKTADSHHHLGFLYEKLGDAENSRKEYKICRGIRCKIFGESSLYVAQCDFVLGQLDREAGSWASSYVAFYRCWRTRCVLMGETHEATAKAFSELQLARYRNEERIIIGAECKDRVVELGWNSLDHSLTDEAGYNPTQLQYTVSCHIMPLDNDEVLDLQQLRVLVATALQSYYDARRVKRAMQSDASKPHVSFDGSADDDEDLISASFESDIEAITRLLLISPSICKRGSIIRPYVEPETAKAETPVKPSEVVDTTPSPRIPISPRATPAVASAPVPAVIEASSPKPLKKSLSDSAPRPGSASKTAAAAPLSWEEALKEADAASPFRKAPTKASSGKERTKSPLKPSAASTLKTKAKAAVPDPVQPTQAVKESSPMKALDSAAGTPKKLADRRRLSSVSDAKYTLPFSIGDHEQVLARDASGVLVVIRSVAADLEKLEAGGNKTSAATAAPPVAGPETSEPKGMKAMAAALMRLPGIGPPPGLALGAAGAGGASKAAPPKTGSNGHSLAIGASAEKAKIIPRAPPLPTSWPPVPYKKDAAVAAASGAGAGAGPVVAGMPPPPEAKKEEPGAKIKHIVLDALEAIDGTIFASSTDIPSEVDSLFSDMEDEFSLVSKKGPKRAPSKVMPAKMTQKQESILDPQRTQNVSIMLAKFGRRPITDIVQAVNDFDLESLGVSAVTSLLQFIPTSEDMATINAFLKPKPKPAVAKATADAAAVAAALAGDGEPAVPPPPPPAPKLGKAEEYLLAMSKVPRAEQRLQALSSYLTNQDTLNTIQNSAEAILRAVTEVRGSGRLKYLFKTILDLGNALSKKSKKTPEISGFKLAALSKLGNLKSNSGDTLLQYIINRIYEQAPEALVLAQDMPSLNEARQVVFERLNSDLTKMDKGVELMKSLLAAEVGEVARERLQKALDESTKLFARASTKLAEAIADFKDLVAYFGEDKGLLPETVFGQLLGFVKSVETCTGIADAKAKKAARVDLFKRI